ncbi:MAG: hypothetical protein A2X94_17275 [Bdellovibrionales bacterium GWB1_55_8]|nr:MAG: hypothetical protein A2X94_17275 [Bdellovibrionales bacterium GWB1_55_8]
MKNFILSSIVLAAFAFSPSALAKDKKVRLDVRGVATEKMGFIPIVLNGTPRALSISRTKAIKAASEDAKAQCDELGGKLRHNFASKNPGVTWIQLGKEFESTVEYSIDCIVKVEPEKDPSVSTVQLKPGEVSIGGKIYVEKVTTSAAQ